MKKLIKFIPAILIFLLAASPALASVIDAAIYRGTIKVTNAGEDSVSDASVNLTLDSDSFVAEGYASANLSDIAILIDNDDTAFMPGYDGKPWMVWVPLIGAKQYVNYELYSVNVTGGTIRYFPDDAGMTVADNGEIKLGDNFTTELKGWVNTDNGSGKNLIFKAGAIKTYISSAENITTEIYTTTSLEQTTENLGEPVADGGYTRYGARYDDFPATTITEVQFYLKKYGSPTGTGYVRVRKVSDDSIIATMGTFNVADIPAGNTWIAYNDESATIDVQQDIRIAFEFSGGSAAQHAPVLRYSDSDEDALIEETRWTAGPWSEDATEDVAIKIFYAVVGTSVTASDIPSDNHTITTTANVTHLAIYVDGGDPKAITPLSANVTDNTANWTFCSGGSMPYMEYTSITVDGELAGKWEWEYSDNFTDQGGDNDAIPTFRTTSSSANVSANLTSFQPITQAKITTFTLGGEILNILTGAPSAPGELYAEGDYTKIPGADAVNVLLAEGEIPQALWWYPVIYISIGIIGFLVYGATTLRVRQGRISGDSEAQGSLLAMCIVCEVLMALVGVMGLMPLWPAFLFLIPVGAIIVSMKHWSWG